MRVFSITVEHKPWCRCHRLSLSIRRHDTDTGCEQPDVHEMVALHAAPAVIHTLLIGDNARTPIHSGWGGGSEGSGKEPAEREKPRVTARSSVGGR